MKKVIAALAAGGLLAAGGMAHANIFHRFIHSVEHAAEAAKKSVEHATHAATTAVHKAMSVDYDSIAESVIDASAYPAPFRDAVLKELVKVTPEQIRGVTEAATTAYKKIDDENNQLRAQTYRNLYHTYKGDAAVVWEHLKNRDTDFREYYRYVALYDIATEDWKKDPKGAAKRVAMNRYTAYVWYNKHTVRGAATDAARDRYGLDNASLEKGLKELKDDLKGIGNGVVSIAVLTEFMILARPDFIGPNQELEQGAFIISKNGKYSVTFQGDCNLVFVGPKAVKSLLSHERHGDFAEYARNRNRCTCVQQSDGNLVVYGFQGNKPVGATTGSHPKGQYFTVVQDDGNVVTYHGTDPAHRTGGHIWSLGTDE